MSDEEFQKQYEAAAEDFGGPHGVDRTAFRAQVRHFCYENCDAQTTTTEMVKIMADTHAAAQIQAMFA